VRGELEGVIDNVVKHIRKLAASWDHILSYSAWASSVGSLVNKIATKIITDVFDLGDVSVNDAEQIATLISRVMELDDLFIPRADGQSKGNSNLNSKTNEGTDEDPVPMTAQFADKWLKLGFLSQVLQSNLNDIKYMWFESDLSFYFTADEVVELIGLSFENNPNVRQAIREIREKPPPMLPE
jgi:centromere/kinetochore protein ZW10